MLNKESLNNLFEKQKAIISEYEKVLRDFEEDDLINKNQELQKELENHKVNIEDLKEKNKKILEQNQGLKIALEEQILDEKLNIIKISKDKINTYFEKTSEEYSNNLISFEVSARQQLENLSMIAASELNQEQESFKNKISLLQKELNQAIVKSRESFSKGKDDIIYDLQNRVHYLEEEGVSEEVIQKRIKRNNLEIKFGLSFVNWIGIFLILIGVAAFLRYSYIHWFAEYMKGLFAFALGLIFLVVGEIFNRKEKDVFAKGLTGGGIAILYYAIFNAFFVFGIITMEVALGLSVLVTLVCVVLSLYHNSRTICSLSLIGGYLPFFAYVFKFGLNGNSLYLAMGYLLLLNLMILAISYKKNWSITNYISFILNVPSLIYLVFQVQSNTIGIIYSVFTFAMYLMVTLSYPFKNKIGLKTADVFLLALNTFISCIIIYSLFDAAKLGDYKGLLAILFCLTYFVLGQFIDKYMNNEKFTKILFYLTSLTFAILIIPFQFGVKWLAMGWLVEGLLMIICGYRYKFKNIEIAGWITYAFCLLAFLFVDVVNNFSIFRPYTDYFDFKYTFITIGSILVLFMYLIDISKNIIAKYSQRGKLITAFKYIVTLNFWLYSIYEVNKIYEKLVNFEYNNYFFKEFYGALLFAITTIIVGFIISVIPLLKDKAIKYFEIALYLIGDITCLGLTLDQSVLNTELVKNSSLEYFGFALLLLFNIFVFFNLRYLIINIIKDTNKSLEIYPILMAIYLIFNITGFMIVQFEMENINLTFSLIYILLAFLYIIYGFKFRYIMIRRFGLGLSIFATAKLFIYDLSFLSTGGRIIAYFSFGFVMLGISYIYQRISNALEDKHEGSRGEQL